MDSRSREEGLGLSAAVLFPNKREVACASLGFLKVFEALRRRVALTDMAYVPSGPGDAVLSPKRGLLIGEVSRHEIARFDVVGFSVSYENDYVNVPGLLMMAGLEPLAAERPEAFPLVLCGGFTMSTNPLPVADFIDAAVVGEIEPVADSLLEIVERAKAGAASAHDKAPEADPLSKAGLLAALGRLPGVYVPALGELPVERLWSDAEHIEPEPGARPDSHFGDMRLVEVGRGCGRGCRFCAAGNLYRPVRVRRGESVLEAAGDAERVGLVGTAVGDHPDLESMLGRLTDQGRRVGISSMRPDQITPRVASLLVKGGVRTIAVAPEAGTEALRARIGKPMKESQIAKAVETLAAAGISTIKLYFMIGLPGETDGDVEAIVELIERLALVRGRARLGVTAGPFVPKPHTVFQWAPFEARDTLKRRMSMLRRVRSIRGCSLKVQPVDEAWVEAVLARGDRSLSAPILEAARSGKPLKRLLLRGGWPDPGRELDMEKPLPWDFIDSGVDREGLKRKYLSLKGPSQPPPT